MPHHRGDAGLRVPADQDRGDLVAPLWIETWNRKAEQRDVGTVDRGEGVDRPRAVGRHHSESGER